MIANAVQTGDTVVVYDDRGSILFIVPAGTQPGDGLTGYTQSRVNVRQGGFITTYDEKGNTVNIISVI